MKKNKYLHRFVALVMTAVMLLSLVVIDNRIGMKAEDEYTKEVPVLPWKSGSRRRPHTALR